ncbi:DUF4190 domain-containing protein [Microbacterium tumbae]
MTNPPYPEPSNAPQDPSPYQPPAAPPASGYPADPTPPAAPGYPAAPQPYPVGGSAPAPVPGRGLAIAGLVLAFLVAPVGLIISIVAAVKLGKAGAPKGLAIAGIIVGAVITLLWIVGIIGLVALFGSLFAMCDQLGPGVWDVNGVTYTCS